MVAVVSVSIFCMVLLSVTIFIFYSQLSDPFTTRFIAIARSMSGSVYLLGGLHNGYYGFFSSEKANAFSQCRNHSVSIIQKYLYCLCSRLWLLIWLVLLTCLHLVVQCDFVYFYICLQYLFVLFTVFRSQVFMDSVCSCLYQCLQSIVLNCSYCIVNTE